MPQTMMNADTGLALTRQAEMNAAAAAARLQQAAQLKNSDAIEEAAQDFEAVFVAEMLKPMFEGIKSDPLFGGGKGEEVFRGMMIQEYGKIIAARGGIGIAEHVKAELIRIQADIEQGGQNGR